MQMTEDEIYRSYKEAKEPQKQIRILAQLNCCDTDKIKEIIASHGEPVPKRKYTRRQPVKVQPPEKPQAVKKSDLPESVIAALKQKIMFLESDIERYATESENCRARADEIREFLKNHEV